MGRSMISGADPASVFLQGSGNRGASGAETLSAPKHYFNAYQWIQRVPLLSRAGNRLPLKWLAITDLPRLGKSGLKERKPYAASWASNSENVRPGFDHGNSIPLVYMVNCASSAQVSNHGGGRGYGVPVAPADRLGNLRVNSDSVPVCPVNQLRDLLRAFGLTTASGVRPPAPNGFVPWNSVGRLGIVAYCQPGRKTFQFGGWSCCFEQDGSVP